MANWTSEETELITMMWFEGYKPDEMANQLPNRTKAACQGMMWRIAFKMLGEQPRRTAGLRDYLG